ncbi:MAG: hypothetical protein CL677_08080 [Bdellovibrionaceae bacterium]|nr:hypothetical protein [Pseudobdellovibrionaceae bacterium]
MKINVQVKTRSKIESVEKQLDGSYLVRVNVPPVEGKANKRIIELLSKYLKIPKSNIELISGPKSKIKVFKIH